MTAYYNEIDPYAAQWLRNLIDAGHIAPGDVDERSIEDVVPSELSGYTQCHFFAGIGVWSLALRQAGWPDDKPVWTGSCPCQPFSAAGKGAGFDDERHLWPSFHWLIDQCRPPAIFGEQVASKAVEPWIDLVQADLEAMGYAFGCVPFPSAGVGAPHIRDRAFWMGHANDSGPQGHTRHGGTAGWEGPSGSAAPAGVSGGLADSNEREGGERHEPSMQRGWPNYPQQNGMGRSARGLADAPSTGRQRGRTGETGDGGDTPRIESERLCETSRKPATGPTNGHWRDADWLLCRDGKWRPVEPGTFPLVDGAPARVVRLRAYGNAINAKAAEEFIRSAMDRNNG